MSAAAAVASSSVVPVPVALARDVSVEDDEFHHQAVAPFHMCSSEKRVGLASAAAVDNHNNASAALGAEPHRQGSAYSSDYHHTEGHHAPVSARSIDSRSEKSEQAHAVIHHSSVAGVVVNGVGAEQQQQLSGPYTVSETNSDEGEAYQHYLHPGTASGVPMVEMGVRATVEEEQLDDTADSSAGRMPVPISALHHHAALSSHSSSEAEQHVLAAGHLTTAEVQAASIVNRDIIDDMLYESGGQNIGVTTSEGMSTAMDGGVEIIQTTTTTTKTTNAVPSAVIMVQDHHQASSYVVPPSVSMQHYLSPSSGVGPASSTVTTERIVSNIPSSMGYSAGPMRIVSSVGTPVYSLEQHHQMGGPIISSSQNGVLPEFYSNMPSGATGAPLHGVTYSSVSVGGTESPSFEQHKSVTMRTSTSGGTHLVGSSMPIISGTTTKVPYTTTSSGLPHYVSSSAGMPLVTSSLPTSTSVVTTTSNPVSGYLTSVVRERSSPTSLYHFQEMKVNPLYNAAESSVVIATREVSSSSDSEELHHEDGAHIMNQDHLQHSLAAGSVTGHGATTTTTTTKVIEVNRGTSGMMNGYSPVSTMTAAVPTTYVSTTTTSGAAAVPSIIGGPAIIGGPTVVQLAVGSTAHGGALSAADVVSMQQQHHQLHHQHIVEDAGSVREGVLVADVGPHGEPIATLEALSRSASKEAPVSAKMMAMNNEDLHYARSNYSKSTSKRIAKAKKNRCMCGC